MDKAFVVYPRFKCALTIKAIICQELDCAVIVVNKVSVTWLALYPGHSLRHTTRAHSSIVVRPLQSVSV